MKNKREADCLSARQSRKFVSVGVRVHNPRILPLNKPAIRTCRGAVLPLQQRVSGILPPRFLYANTM